MTYLFQENVSTLQHQSIWAPTFCQLCRHGGYGPCRQLQIQGKYTGNTHWVLYALFGFKHSTELFNFLISVVFHTCFACRQNLGIKTDRLQYVKGSSLQPDIGLPTLGRSPPHIKAFQCFLFVHSRLEAQSISIPPYSQSLNEEQSAIHTFDGSCINCCGPFGHRYCF